MNWEQIAVWNQQEDTTQRQQLQIGTLSHTAMSDEA